MSQAPKTLPLGELLVVKGVISSDQLHIALTEQKKSGSQLGKELVRLGFVSDATLRESLSENLGQVSVDLSNVLPTANAIALIPKDVAKRNLMLPLALDIETKKLTVAMANPNNLVALDQVRTLLRNTYELMPMLGAEADIIRAIDQYYGFELSIDGILHEIETGQIDYISLSNVDAEYSQPVVRLIDALLADAVHRSASDVHFEPEQQFVRIRYRIDGVLRQIRSLHKTYWPAMVVRLKVMSGMNIAETRAPQDGRISLGISGRQLDFRVAAQPTVHGENVVLRILDRHKGLVPLDHLGLPDDNLHLLKLMIARPEGIILVTGPTGSGKTTTLYSILSHINSEGVNIMTLEDPVEYPLPMIRQTSVSEKVDFSSGIRSMMRQDPDIILVGEIRDKDTAEMAFRAAMTGHQVYSTLHTNSAVGAIPRLLDIGVLPDIMAGNIIGVIAQRLVRKLCQSCKVGKKADDFERHILGMDSAQSLVLYQPQGCSKCDNQGYKGRLSILEILKFDGDLDELIAHRSTTREIRLRALEKGFRPLAEDAIRRVLEGITSLDEIARVVDLTDRI
ncbi:GspE/PulE family protein [Chitinimonas sp. BJB300]|uniref:GspE/PulE family protein n=1 Tax=Chitinimonas sp. BJB300 TaxID=1559339 RepID=UPI000C104AA5|nr:ATPase, T2SS/T4P/T4SS family [Chitinimonas sp. BJB300]PHV11069.1 secretion system protein E [Chitinimonas sp. BJB300]TSJ91524.1 secretion system protein E [Chitinimonas sp. BJB300]